MKNIALSRAAGAATAFTVFYGIVQGSKAIFGVSDEEGKQLQEI